MKNQQQSPPAPLDKIVPMWRWYTHRDTFWVGENMNDDPDFYRCWIMPPAYDWQRAGFEQVPKNKWVMQLQLPAPVSSHNKTHLLIWADSPQELLTKFLVWKLTGEGDSVC